MKKSARCGPKTETVRKRILMPISCLLLGMLVLLCALLLGIGLPGKLDRSSIAAMDGRVISRANHLQAQIWGRWSDVGYTARSINETFDRLAAAPDFTPASLVRQPQQYNAFFLDAAPQLIYLMRNAGVTGAFVVLNDKRYPSGPAPNDTARPCLYISDRDPVSAYTDKNTDLLLEYAPVDTARMLEIACDSGWMPLLTVRAGEEFPAFATEPFNALLSQPTASALECGYWSLPYQLPGSSDAAISYSVPLVSDEGAVYGTLGVEISLRHLQTMLSPTELGESSNGLYHLFAQPVGNTDPAARQTIAVCAPLYGNSLAHIKTQLLESLTPPSLFEGRANAETIFLREHTLTLYGPDSPFQGTEWGIAGGLPGHTLFDVTNKTLLSLVSMVLGVGLLFILGLFAISGLITKPVEQLSRQLQASSSTQPLQLHKTGITEIDVLSGSIEGMRHEMHQFANKFSDILNMANNNIGGFEYKRNDGSLFVNDSFFTVFGHAGLHASSMPLAEFSRRMDDLLPYHISHRTLSDSVQEHLFCLPQPSGDEIWARVRYFWRDDHCVGLAEDVSAERRELDKVAYERDHDVLTGLLNRRAWSRQVNALFAEARTLKNALLLMMDLDNLKFVNDTYGHDAGDAYICAAADALREVLPQNAVLCRKSGDEFLVLLYGYDAKHDLRSLMPLVHEKFHGEKISLKNGSYYPLRASGGVAWYPTDSTDLGTLLRYADFAMYKAKNRAKGDICYFESDSYQREAYILQGTLALDELLEHELVDYFFQPILDVRTGEVFAYEALMRPRVKGLHSPADVVDLARREGKLEAVERLTWFCAMDAFVRHCRQGFVSDSCRIFINSVPSNIMNSDDIALFAERFRGYLHRIVEEQTEAERPDSSFQHRKMEVLEAWGGAFALDDYGSGYNSEKMLLLFRPQFVKIDMSLVTGIEENLSQQQMITNIVQYGNSNNIRVIAEGVETAQEAATLIRLGVHYLQGYYMARPALIPPLVPADVVESIVALSTPMRPALEFPPDSTSSHTAP